MKTSHALTLAALPAVFGVSSMSIYLWRQGTATKDPLEAPYTPTRLRAWAKKNNRPIVKDPDVVLAKYQKMTVKKAGRPTATTRAAPKKAPGKKLQRTASGRLTGVKKSSGAAAHASA